jgi:hypothetical protein
MVLHAPQNVIQRPYRFGDVRTLVQHDARRAHACLEPVLSSPPPAWRLIAQQAAPQRQVMKEILGAGLVPRRQFKPPCTSLISLFLEFTTQALHLPDQTIDGWQLMRCEAHVYKLPKLL